jgi:multidrug efflux pump
VDVQNRIKAIEPRLPRSVRQNGLFVEAADSGFLMLVGLRSPDASVSEAALGDFMARNIIEELRRIDGVGRVQLFGAEQAMRVWLDPTRLTGYGLTMGDVAAAIEQQNLEISPGRIGDSPGVPGQRITVPLSADGQLSTPEQFAAIVLRAGADGSRVVLGDVARVELGAQSACQAPARTAIRPPPPACSCARRQRGAYRAAVRERMAELAPLLPRGGVRASRSTPRRSSRSRSRRWCRRCWRRCCWCSW